MKKLTLTLTFAFALLLTMSQNACTGHSIEVQKLDSMEQALMSIDTMLDLDIALLNKRSDLIGKQRQFIMKNYKDTFSYELGAQLSRYKMLMKRYKEYAGKHGMYTTEAKTLHKQVEDLRAYYHSSEYDKEEFKTYLRTERSDIIQLHADVSAMRTELYELEPEYYRVSDFIDAHIERMLQKDTTLHL